jgi:hypothetical protein
MCWHRVTDHEVLYQALGVQRLLSVNDVIRMLRSEVKRAGSQRAFAREAGVNVSVVSKTLRGIVLPSKKSSLPSNFALSIYPNDKGSATDRDQHRQLLRRTGSGQF